VVILNKPEEVFKALLENGIDEKKRIVDADAPHPLLYNIPVEFEGMQVYDMGAYPEALLSGSITERVLEPWKRPQNENEQAAVDKMWDMIDRLKKKRSQSDTES
jgi:hypothetical protein